MNDKIMEKAKFQIERIKEFNGEAVEFLDSDDVTDGVVCDVYKFNSTKEKDLGIVKVKSGHKTPLQRVLKGDKTIEIFIKGSGVLRIFNDAGKITEYLYPETADDGVVVKIGQLMQWEALEEDLIFAEICYPPYEDGRFENIDEN
jgi:hypothetical protein